MSGQLLDVPKTYLGHPRNFKPNFVSVHFLMATTVEQSQNRPKGLNNLNLYYISHRNALIFSCIIIYIMHTKN